jgi:protein gp37
MRHRAYLDGWTSAPVQYRVPFSTVQCLAGRLSEPLHWRKPRRIFVCSMADLFHPDVPDAFIANVWIVMGSESRHTFQVLTKRPRRMRSWVQKWARTLPNVHLGVTCEDQQRADERIPILLDTPACVRFVSVEPMLGPVDASTWLAVHRVDLGEVGGGRRWTEDTGAVSRLDWVIAGCESGPNARPSEVEWFRSLRDQCVAAGVPYFLKQMDVATEEETRSRLEKMPALDGRVWDQVPEVTP